jgi:hypothetical protein
MLEFEANSMKFTERKFHCQTQLTLPGQLEDVAAQHELHNLLYEHCVWIGPVIITTYMIFFERMIVAGPNYRITSHGKSHGIKRLLLHRTAGNLRRR